MRRIPSLLVALATGTFLAFTAQAAPTPGPSVDAAAKPARAAHRVGVSQDAPVKISIPDLSADNINATFTFLGIKGCEWKVSEGFVYAITNEHTEDCDAWAIAPGVRLKAGKKYFVAFNAASDANCRDIAEVRYGTAPTVEAMTSVLQAATELTSADHVKLGNFITPATDQELFFALHVMTPAANAGGGLDFTLFEAGEPSKEEIVIPACPTGVKVNVVDSVITVSWNAVTTNDDGQPLADPSRVRYDIQDYNTRQVYATDVAGNSWIFPGNALTMSPPKSLQFYVSSNIDGYTNNTYSYNDPVNVGKWVAPCEYSSVRQWANTWTAAKVTGWEGNNVGNYGLYEGVGNDFANKAMLCCTASNNGMDIWAMSPQTVLKGGVTYHVDVDACTGTQNKAASFELKLGTEPTIDAMATEVIPTTVINTYKGSMNNAAQRCTGSFTVPADGVYYLGFHATGEAGNCSSIGFKYLNVFGGYANGTPGKPADLKAVAKRDGTTGVDISVKAPAKTVDGLDLTAISRIELARDGETINTWNAPQPGAALTYADNAPQGEHAYKVTAFNNLGAGEPAETSVLAGVAVAKRPTNVDAARQDDGTVLVKWTAPTMGMDGTKLPEGSVTYNVYQETSLIPRLVATGLTGTTAAVQPVQPERYRVADYLVSAVTAEGESEMSSPSSAIAIGQAVDMPWSESFATAAPQEMWARDKDFAPSPDVNPLTWGLNHYNSSQHPQDDDCGFLQLYCKNVGGTAGVTTPLIRVTGDDPVARMYAFAHSATDKNDLIISVNDGTGWTVLTDSLVNSVSAGSDKYGFIDASLKPYLGKDVMVKFAFKVASTVYTNMDNFAVFDRADKNVGIARIEVNDLDYNRLEELPDLSVGTTTRVRVAMRHFGKGATDGLTPMPAKVTVTLKRDGVDVGTSDVIEILPSQGAVAQFADVLPGAVAGKDVTYTATLTYADDQVAADNTRSRTLHVAATKAPAGTQLAGSIVDDNLSLTWTAPDYADVEAPQAFDDFEDCPAYATDGIGDWRMIDLDNRPCSFSNAFLKSHIQKAAWFVMQNPTPDYVFTLFTCTPVWRNGFKSMMSNNGIIGADDWAVLPELSGKAQTISFVCSSGKGNVGRLALYTSTDGNEAADFSELCQLPNLYEGSNCNASSGCSPYRPYAIEVPEGTKYAAIRIKYEGSVSNIFKGFDDVRYTPARKNALELKGYNIYRDGEQINANPVETTSFAQEGQPAGKHKYAVTAVYNEGESAPCAEVELESTSGILDPTVARTEVARFAADGRRVDGDYQGVVIVKYSDGTARKMVNVK